MNSYYPMNVRRAPSVNNTTIIPDKFENLEPPSQLSLEQLRDQFYEIKKVGPRKREKKNILTEDQAQQWYIWQLGIKTFKAI